MSEQILPLADVAPAVTRDDWLAAVDKILRGRGIDRIRTTLDDGIVVEPLYTAADAPAVGAWPGAGDARRSGRPEGSTGGWDIRATHVVGDDASDDAALNTAILHDLTRGVMSIELDTRTTLDVDRLDAILAEVLLDLAPVALVSVDDGLANARAFCELLARREMPAGSVRAHLGCDPIGRLIDRGGVEGGIDAAVAAVAAFAAEVASTHPQLRAIRVDGSPVARGGASAATELATIVAGGVAWLRALTDAGLGVADAVDQLQFVVTVGTDQFADLAKLRALRVLWARVADASGAPGAVPEIQASMLDTVLSEYDPWVNMLRGTVACFAAAVGGADAVVVAPFDAAVGRPDDLGRRIARNTQLVLGEESNLHRVIDPAGGSYYVESLTDALADAAWAQFQGIEAAGGIVAALRAGIVQDAVDATWAARSKAVATRRAPITGVSEFPQLDAEPLRRAAVAATPGLVADPEARPVPSRRPAEAYEALRRAADAAPERPRIFLANLGPVATHTARASWATNAFASGGIAAVGNEGFASPAEAADAFAASGCRIAVLCSSDDVYADQAVAAAQAIKAAGAARLYLAGDPGDRRAAEEAAGVDEFVHVGVDLVAALQRAHAALELEPPPGSPAEATTASTGGAR
ncbi:MAG: methylmalonyl-CoA mutase family protein [Acidimicrobiales bacterium]